MILEYHCRVDVSEPARALAPGLTVPLLRALASRSTPATAAQLSRVARTGTKAGVRRALERLALHGVCASDQVGDRTVYSLNHEHVLYNAVTELLRADKELPQRLRASLATWKPAPISAALFGSAARRDGDVRSDIDLLVVRPVMRTDSQRRAWVGQTNHVRSQVHTWTGNRLQILDRSRASLTRLVRASEPIIAQLRDDAITVSGEELVQLIEELA